MTIMEQKGFTYIENFAFIHLSAKKIIKFLIEKNTPSLSKAKETKLKGQQESSESKQLLLNGLNGQNDFLTKLSQHSTEDDEYEKRVPKDADGIKKFILKELSLLPKVDAKDVLYKKKSQFF